MLDRHEEIVTACAMVLYAVYRLLNGVRHNRFEPQELQGAFNRYLSEGLRKLKAVAILVGIVYRYRVNDIDKELRFGRLFGPPRDIHISHIYIYMFIAGAVTWRIV